MTETKMNEPRLHRIRGEDVYLHTGEGFVAPPPRKGRLPYIDEPFIKAAVESIKKEEFKTAQKAARSICKGRIIPEEGASKEAIIDRVARAVRAKLK